MDLLKSWVIGAVAWIGISLIIGALITSLATEAMLGSVGGRILVDFLPALVTTACVAAAAALLHPAPQRMNTSRHAAAALVVPALSIIANVVVIAVDGPVAVGILVGNVVAGVLGAFAGWRLADRVYASAERRDASRGQTRDR